MDVDIPVTRREGKTPHASGARVVTVILRLIDTQHSIAGPTVSLSLSHNKLEIDDAPLMC